MIEKLRTAKKLLIVVDMINGFVNEGALADTYIRTIIEENVRLIELFIKNNQPIISVRDSHISNCEEFKEFPVHCLMGSRESESIKELLPFKDKMIDIPKNTTNAFNEELFVQIINSCKSLTEIILIGCCTDICVINLAISLKKYFDKLGLDIVITIPKNGVQTFDNPTHNRVDVNDKAFTLMKTLGMNVVNKYEGEN